MREGAPVFAETHPGAKAIVIAEAPGADEVDAGRPLVGRSGMEATQGFLSIGLRRDDLDWTNACLCVRGDARVYLADGSSERIATLVKNRYAGEVLTVDATGRLTTRHVYGWHRSPRAGRRMFRLTTERTKQNPKGVVGPILTEDHPVLTDRGWVPVAQVRPTDRVATGDVRLSAAGQSLLTGALLGDGCIPPGRRYFTTGHVEGNEDYLRLKAQVLTPLTPSFTRAVTAAQPQVRFQTASSMWLAEVGSRFYRDGRAVVPADLILDPLALAVFFMDDGYTRLRPPKRPSAELSVNGYDEVGVRTIVAALGQMGLDATARSTSVGWRIDFNVEATPRLMEIIAPYVPASMAYKLPEEFRGRFNEALYAPAEALAYWDVPRVEEVATDVGGYPAETVYCIDVEDTAAFVTTAGVVHNCRPPKNDFSALIYKVQKENKRREKAGLEPYLNPIDACRPRLLREIAQHENVFTLGKTGLTAVTQQARSIMDLRGAPIDGWLDEGGFRAWEKRDGEGRIVGRPLKVMPTIHPAFVLRMRRWAKIFRSDLARGARWFNGRLEWREPEVVFDPDPKTLRAFLFSGAPFYAYDVETDAKESLTAKLRCVGIATTEKAVVVGLLSVLGFRLHSTTEEEELTDVLREFFTDERILKIGHNAGYYDRIVIEQQLGVTPKPLTDTILLHRGAESELPHNLGFVGSVYTDVTKAWKASHAATEAQTDSDLWDYNCLMAGTRVVLGDGATANVEDLVRRRYTGEVLSFDGERILPKRVIGWTQKRVPGQRWVKVKHAHLDRRERGLVMTPDHPVWTPSGWKDAGKLLPGDKMLLPEVGLTPYQRSAILGSVIGDGALVASPTWRDDHAHAPTLAFDCVHAKTSGLARYKAKALHGIATLRDGTPAGTATFNGREYPKDATERVASANRADLAQLRHLVYDDEGKRRLRVEALEAMGPVGWAWWFMDDGCRQNGGARSDRGHGERQDTVAIATNGFPREDVLDAVTWMHRRFGPTWVGKDNVIRLGVSATNAFCAAIAPYLPEIMRYKLPRRPWAPFALVAAEAPLPVWTTLTAVEEYVPPRGTPQRDLRAETIYCLTVEDTQRFFTTNGLVHNSTDCVVTARIAPPLVEAVNLRGQRPVVANDHKIQGFCVGLHRTGLFIDRKARDAWDAKLTAEAAEWRMAAKQAAGDTEHNPGSVEQVKALLFRDWGLEAENYTKLGEPSTDDDSIRALLVRPYLQPTQKAYLNALRKFRRAAKLKGTYIARMRPVSESVWLDDLSIDADTPEGAAALGEEDNAEVAPDPEGFFTSYSTKKRGKATTTKPGLILMDGRCHPQWNSHVAVTGRLSSSEPNAQNWPYKIRNMVVPEPGRILVGADMDQIELRMCSALAGAARYLEVFKKGGDPHALTSEFLYGKAFTLADDATRKRLRDFAKRFTYAVLYGASVETVWETITSAENDKGELLFPNVKLSETRLLYDKWLGANPEFYKWWDDVVEEWRRQGYLAEPYLGRRRDFADGEDRNEIINFKAQSCAASIVNMATVDLIEGPIPFDRWGPGTGFFAQVHDALYVECPVSQEKFVKDALKEAMTRTVPGLDVVFGAKPKSGYSWDTCA